MISGQYWLNKEFGKLSFYPTKFAVVVINTDQNQLWGGKGLFYFIGHYEGYQGRNPQQESVDMNWRWGHGEMMLSGLPLRVCSAMFVIQSRTTCPGVVLPTMVWSLSAILYPSLNKEIPYRIGNSPIWWKQFISCLLFWDDSTLCQVNKDSIPRPSLLFYGTLRIILVFFFFLTFW